ncbi:hypothetical protein [Salibacterium halotolerans]|uniref:Uncharacterized protein n=1 Tax=Salibacterium halotolerans TaxID=1884432 RepID=A0A1I5Y720_9BACI|nr:hypothetical protein [Salibacterium halotolerans]SFQ39979.1 hypothetical protein SAMN05518683_1373 [Salibacterium halotolerans]
MAVKYDPLRDKEKKKHKKKLGRRRTILFVSVLSLIILINVGSYIFGFSTDWLDDWLNRLSF